MQISLRQLKINLGTIPSRGFRQKFNSLVRKYKGRNVMLTGGGEDLNFFYDTIEQDGKPPTVNCHDTYSLKSQLDRDLTVTSSDVVKGGGKKEGFEMLRLDVVETGEIIDKSSRLVHFDNDKTSCYLKIQDE